MYRLEMTDGDIKHKAAANSSLADDRLVVCQRLLTRSQAAAYCGLSTSTFSRWINIGLLPAALSGTARWDRTAIDHALDKASNLKGDQPMNEFDLWKERRNARSAKGNS